MFVKICGITRAEDADDAVRCGAAAIGFIFWPASPRYLDPARARAIASRLPPSVKTVGVFVNQPADEINRVADLVGLAAVQLHGDETPPLAAAVHRPVIKAVSAGNGGLDASGWPEEVVMLVDAHDERRRGGTGREADWAAAARLAKERRVLLAGGLTPENVGDAVAAVKPFGIDVSSGVESAPGIKSRERLEALFAALERK